jgi:Methyltransferase domain
MLNRLKWRLGLSAPPQIQRANAIPVVSLGDLLGTAKPEIQLTVQRYEDGMLPSEQAIALLAIVVATAPKSVLEIGTFMGHTTKLLAMNLPEAIIHSVDLPLDFIPDHDNDIGKKKDDFHLIAKRQVGREYRGTPYETRIRQHFVDTAVWNFKEAAGATLFFIDGSHTYDYCKSDSERCYELCRGKGVFLWHDCDDTHPGVVNTLLEWRALGRDVVRIQGTPIAYWNSNFG